MQVDLMDMGGITVALAGVVKALLEGKNKTEAAVAVGVSRQQLYRFESGEAIPTVEELARLAAYTGEELVITVNKRDGEATERLADVEETQLLILREVQRLAGDDPSVQRLFERVQRRQEAREAKDEPEA